jgi:PAS domain S-box-containing protein
MTRERHLLWVSRAHPPPRHGERMPTNVSQPAASSFLSLVAPHLPPALEELQVPAYVIDAGGRIRWLNAAARDVLGADAVGKLFTSVIDPEDQRRARSRFAENLRGDGNYEFALDIVTGSGEERRVEISSVPLRSRHRAIGMFGIAMPRSTAEDRPALIDGRLTARQHEILMHLSQGESTDQIAALLHLSRETVRNHIRHILRRLGTSSRLEAVAVARREQIL